MPSLTRRRAPSVHGNVTVMTDPESSKTTASPAAPDPVGSSPLAASPAEPYVAVIFTSVRTADDADGYAAMADDMDARSRLQPGYLGIESARDSNGVGITVSYWATEADAAAWKQVAEHLGAQRLGRARWYDCYTTRIATVTRSYTWQRADG